MVLKRNFTKPMDSSRTVTVRFTIQRNGSLSGIKVTRSSGNSSLDNAALAAVQRTEHLGPLPASVRQSSVTTEVTFDFS